MILDRGNGDDDVQIIEEPDDGSNDTSAIGKHPSAEMSGKDGGKDQKKKFATIFSQGGPSNQGGESSDESDEDKGQAFYVGGSEKRS